MKIGEPPTFATAGAISPVQPLLDRGEKLIWSGQPMQGVRLQPSDLMLIPFSLMWGGFALFWEAGVLGLIKMSPHQHAPPIFVAFWGIPFVLMGLYLIFGRFFFDAASRRKTWYAITDRRLIILQGLLNRQINSYDYATLSDLNLVERANQSGDILFGTPRPMSGFASVGMGMNRGYRTPGFYSLAGARLVFQQVQAARSSYKP